MDEFKDMLRDSNVLARALTFGMIPLFFKLSLSFNRWLNQGEIADNLKLFGSAGILLGAYVGHQLYYRWIFPEKRKSTSF